MSDYDSPWKEALDEFLQEFLQMFFPELGGRIDWSVSPEALDGELAKLFPDSEIGRAFVDRLYKVLLVDGDEIWVLIHIEVQTQREENFAARIFRYFYRLFDKFDLPFTCLIVLADDNPNWRPSEYVYEFAGTRNQFTFPTVKLDDYRSRIDELERSSNPFVLIVLAHLQSQSVKETTTRLEWKRRILRNLQERFLDEKSYLKVVKLVDWLMIVPDLANVAFWDDVRIWQEKQPMPYVTSFEREAMQRGRVEGREEGSEIAYEGIKLALKSKFGEAGKVLASEINAFSEPTQQRKLMRAIDEANSLEEVRRQLAELSKDANTAR